MSPRSETADNGYFAMKLDALRLDSVVDFTLWIRSGESVVLYRQDDLAFDSESIERLRGNKVEELLVSRNDQGKFCRYIESNFIEIMNDSAIEESEKARITHLAATNLAQELIVRPDQANLGRARALFLSTAGHVGDAPEFLGRIISAASTDGQLSSHCINVALYTLALAAHLNVGDRSMLGEYTLAGFLADVGKTHLPARVLQNPQQLGDNDLAVVRQHPIKSVEMVTDHIGDESEVARAILQHHERTDGSGYPNGLTGTEISRMAQVVGIADAFDGIKNDRPDRIKATHFEALKLMTSDMRAEFDAHLLRSFVLCLGSLPVETFRAGAN